MSTSRPLPSNHFSIGHPRTIPMGSEETTQLEAVDLPTLKVYVTAKAKCSKEKYYHNLSDAHFKLAKAAHFNLVSGFDMSRSLTFKLNSLRRELREADYRIEQFELTADITSRASIRVRRLEGMGARYMKLWSDTAWNRECARLEMLRAAGIEDELQLTQKEMEEFEARREKAREIFVWHLRTGRMFNELSKVMKNEVWWRRALSRVF